MQFPLNQLFKKGKIHFFRKNELIYSAWSNIDSIFIIKRGKVKLFHLTEDGREIAFDLLSEGEIFGTLNGVAPEFASAYEESEITVIPTTKIKDLDRTELLYIINSFSRNLNRTKERLWWFLSLPLEKRILLVADFLSLKVGRRLNGVIRLNISHQELASFCGASRECVSRLLQDFKNKGIAEVKRKQIVIYITENLKQED